MRTLTAIGLTLAAATLLRAAEVRSLDGEWKIATDPDNAGKAGRWYDAPPPAGARTCVVPDILERTFPGYDGVVWYWKEFPATKLTAAERLLLRFDAADYLAEVWVNGQPAGA